MACKVRNTVTGEVFDSQEKFLESLKGLNKNSIEYVERLLKTTEIKSDDTESKYYIEEGKHKSYKTRVTKFIQTVMADKYEPLLRYNTDKYIEVQSNAYDIMKKNNNPEVVGLSKSEYISSIENNTKNFQKIADGGTKSHKILEEVINNNVKTLEQLKEIDNKELQEALTWFKDEKTLNDFLKIALEFKSDLDFRYKGINYKLLTETVLYDKEKALAGTTDLLIIKEVPIATGEMRTKIDIIDYKFSLKNVKDWSDAKSKQITYQQYFYRNMIRRKGLEIDQLLILPFQFDIDFENNKILFTEKDNIEIINNFEKNPEGENVNQELPTNVSTDSQKLKSNEDIYEFLQKFFNQSKEEIKESKLSEKEVDSKAKYYKVKGFYKNVLEKKEIPFTDTPEDRAELEKYLLRMAEYRKNISKNISKFVLDTRTNFEGKKNKLAEIPGTLNKTENTEIVKNLTLGLDFLWKEYVINSDGKRDYVWEIVDSPEATDLDLLVIRKNEKLFGSKEYKVISITNKNLDDKIYLDLTKKVKAIGKTLLNTGTSIGGNFFNKNKENELGLMDANEGNIEMVKAALFVLQNDKLFTSDTTVSGIYAVSEQTKPKYAPINFLLNNVRKLIDNDVVAKTNLADFILKEKRITSNNFNSDYKQELYDYYSTLVGRISEDDTLSEYKSVRNNLNKSKSDEAALRKFLLNRQEQLLGIEEEKQTEWERNELKMVSEAILGLNRISECFEQDDLSKTAKDYETAPNILKKPFRIIRDLYNSARNKLVERMKKLVRASQDNFKALYDQHGILRANVLGLHSKSYENLYEYALVDGVKKKTMRFRSLDDTSYNYKSFDQTSLTEAEKKVLKMFFDLKSERLVSKFQGKGLEENLTDEKVREIPLVLSKDLAPFLNEIKKDGISDTIEKRLKLVTQDADNEELIPTSFEDMADKLKVGDLFRYQESGSARDILLQKDPSEYEQNVEFLYYLYAYSGYKSDEYSNVLPVMQAARTLVNLSSHYWFTKMPNLLEVMDEYFVGAVHGQKVINPELREAAEGAYKIKSWVSTILQGLSPGTGAVQALTSLWSTISSLVGKHSDRVSWKSFLKAGQLLIGEQSAMFDNVNFINYLDQDYRITGLEPENVLYTFGEQNKGLAGKRGSMFNSRWMMWMSTMPDRFFRMLWFLSENIEKGVIKVDKFGIDKTNSALVWDETKRTVVYRPEKDDRYKDYFGKGKNFEEHKALYEFMIKELKTEDQVDGERPLKAWLERESRSMRTVAGSIFADQSEETKSAFERSIFGILFTQFKRWMYGKREIYWKSNHVEQETGKFEVLKDKDGNILKDSNGDPIIDWKGNIQEGILQTLYFVTKEVGYYKNPRVLKEFAFIDGGLSDYQRRNLRHLLSDVLLYGALLALSKGLFDDEKERNSFSKIYMRYLYNSGKDILFFNTFWNLGTQTSPFVTTSFLDTMLKDVVGNAITGDFDKSGDTLFKSVGITRLPYQIYKYSTE